MSQPNIILLMTDQQRWDSLGCNGNTFVSTPHVDRLAAGGANCTNSFTPWPVCTPARATMWTGVYPHRHQVIYSTYMMDNLLKETSHEQRTVFESVRQAATPPPTSANGTWATRTRGFSIDGTVGIPWAATGWTTNVMGSTSRTCKRTK